MTIAFYLAGFIAIFSTIMVITRTEAVHALLYLIVSLLSVAVVFFLIGAPFIAALEVIIYAGAIMVLFIFVVMLLNLGSEAKKTERQILQPAAWIIPALLALILLLELTAFVFSGQTALLPGRPVSAQTIGISLFGPYLLGVELAAFLLLAGIIGAFHLGRKEKKFYHRFLEEKAE